MYSIGKKFTTNYDDSTWTIDSNTQVMVEDGAIVPAYGVRISSVQGVVAVSHETINQGVQEGKLISS
ncbi:hypothetical protein [Vibrio diabolicus]|uniref:hypothetical protein n=1 Tax=Vibrio diabolicus TaxID=50719 RepID=UPI003D7E51D6